MTLETIGLGDSLTLDYICTDRFKKSRLSAVMVFPSEGHDAAALPLIMPVSIRGTENYRDFASLCRRCDELYLTEINDVGAMDGDNRILGLRASFLDNRFTDGEDLLDGAAELLSQIILHPLLSAETVENEKINQINRIRGIVNDPFSFAKHRMNELMFKGEPRGYRMEEFEKKTAEVTPESVAACRDSVIGRARIEFFFCGTTPLEQVTATILKYFGGYVAKKPESCKTKVVRRAEELKSETLEGPYCQSSLLIGFRSGAVLDDKEFYAAELMNTVFGDGSTSKLFLNVREKKSLCYFCGSGYDECKGIITVGCGIDGGSVDEAKSEIYAQLEAIRRGEITDAELEAAKKAIASDCREAEDHPGDYESFYRVRRYFGGPATIGEYHDNIMRVTREEIAEAACRVTPDTEFFLRGTLEGDDEE